MNGIAFLRSRVLTFCATGLAALAVFASSAVPARALGSLPRFGSASPDTIQGIVFDSLLHQPIPNATVQADADGGTTTTDAEGRFILITPGTVHQLTVFHDFLDRTGLGSLQADITDKTRHSVVILSTPSIATIWTRLCPGRTIEKGRSGIVYGTVRATDGKTRLAGAQVRVSWDFNASKTPGAPAARNSDAKTDATGTYYICGAPPSDNVYVLGYSSEMRSGAITVPGDTLPLRRVDLTLGQLGNTATIRGIVRDTRRAPLAGATIDVDGVEAQTKTDVNGRFMMPFVPTGSRTMAIRALGFSPLFQPITVLDKQNDLIEVDMLATALPSVSVTGRQNVSHLQLDYEQRRREGFGTFKDSTEIVKHSSIRSVFQGIPSLVIVGTGSEDQTAFTLFSPGLSINQTNPGAGCVMNIYIDGQISDTSVLTSLSKEQIAAIEVYIRQEVAPGQYVSLGNDCGVVLVWTKLQFKK